MKKIIFTVIGLVCISLVSAQEIKYIVNKDAYMYDGNHLVNERDVLEDGDIVYYNNESIPYGGTTDYVASIEIRTENGQKGWIDINSLTIPGSNELPTEIAEKEWVYAYYIDILQSGERETLFKYEPFWRDVHDEKYAYGHGIGFLGWTVMVSSMDKFNLNNIKVR